MYIDYRVPVLHLHPEGHGHENAMSLAQDSVHLQAAALIDLARARLFLGEDMEGEAWSNACLVGDDAFPWMISGSEGWG